MKKFLKSLICSFIISIALLQNCSAFFLGSDDYTPEQYAAAGITWTHNTIYSDIYDFHGYRINQSTAEKIVRFYNKQKDTIATLSTKDYIDMVDTAFGIISETQRNLTNAGITWDRSYSSFADNTFYFHGQTTNYSTAKRIADFYKKHNDIVDSRFVGSLSNEIINIFTTALEIERNPSPTDTHTKEEYANADVEWTHYTIFPDSYYFHGHRTSSYRSNEIVLIYNRCRDAIARIPNNVYADIIDAVYGFSEFEKETNDAYIQWLLDRDNN